MIRKVLPVVVAILLSGVVHGQAPADTVKEVFTFVEQMPEYPGGNDALFRFLAANIIYPDSALKSGIEGRVILRFVVDEQGAVGEITALRGPGFGLNEEAIRVASLMPRWKPGRQNGKPVRTYYSLPVQFRLEDEEPKKK